MNEPVRVKSIAGAVGAALLVCEYGIANAAPGEAKATAAAALKGFNFEYTVAGSGMGAPTQVFDDGRRTYFQFRSLNAVPSITAYDDTGRPSAVAYQIESPYVVVDRVTPRYDLTLGNNRTTVLHGGGASSVQQVPSGAVPEQKTRVDSVVPGRSGAVSTEQCASTPALRPESAQGDLLRQAQDLYSRALEQKNVEAQQLLVKAITLLAPSHEERAAAGTQSGFVRTSLEAMQPSPPPLWAAPDDQASQLRTQIPAEFSRVGSSDSVRPNTATEEIAGSAKALTQTKAPFGKRTPKSASRNANSIHAPVLVIDARTAPEPIQTAGSITPVAVSQGGSADIQSSNIRGLVDRSSIASASNATAAQPVLMSGSAAYLPPGSALPAYPPESGIVPAVLSQAANASRVRTEADHRVAMAETRQRDSGFNSERITAEKEKEAAKTEPIVFAVKENQKFSEAVRTFLRANGWDMEWESGSDFVVRRAYSVHGHSLEDVLLAVLTDYRLSAVLYRGNMVAAISASQSEDR